MTDTEAVKAPRKYKFYDKPESDPEAFAAWQAGYRRATVNMLMPLLQMIAIGFIIGMECAR